MQYLHIPVNPVPWTAPSINYKTKGVYKAAELTAFQEAVREHIPDDWEPLAGALELRLWFWRRLDSGLDGASGKRRRAHVVDVTNLQKATEDALQGKLFPNDREVRLVRSQLMAQGPEVNPAIVVGIGALEMDPVDIGGLPHDLWATATRHPTIWDAAVDADAEMLDSIF